MKVPVICLKAMVSYSLLMLCMSVSLLAQPTSQDKAIVSKDSSQMNFVGSLRQQAKLEAQQNRLELQADKTALKQKEIFESIKKTSLKAKSYLNHGIDTLGIYAEIEEVKHWATIAGEGILIRKDTLQTYRNLVASSKILAELLNRILVQKNDLDRYQQNLSTFKYVVDSLSSDTVLYEFPADSLSAVQYAAQLETLFGEVEPVNRALKKAISKVQYLQTQVNQEVTKLNASLELIEAYQKELSAQTFEQELAVLWQATGSTSSLSDILHLSWMKNTLLFRFYTHAHIGKIIWVFLLITFVTVYLRNLKKIIIEENLLHPDFTDQLVLQYPVLSAIVIVLSLFQFIFPDPPFLFNALIWITSAFALTRIFEHFITSYWMKVWLSMLILFLCSCLDNLILQTYETERWMMIFLAMLGILSGLVALTRGPRNELQERWILYFIGFVVVLETFSIIANIFGRYNLSKNLLTSGYFNVIVAILFLWTIRLLNEGLALAFNVYTSQDRQLFNINPERIGKKAPTLLYSLLVLGWFILFGRNFYIFKVISEPLKNFLAEERTIGDYSFSINKILIFMLIMALSLIISRIVSFFATDKPPQGGLANKDEKAGMGSWLLLIRITIISLGLFLAFAAAGIPMDRITLILGALGVGIGFGLQTLVNNLVSGLIIAFEKPVNVGDIVEVAGQTGTMKAIGFRSSIITTLDGADVVMPNGDLLNAHLLNWTLAGNRRRMDVIVGVAYGTDLELVKRLLTDVLLADERILQYPVPVILFQDFGSSSIEIKVLFWVRHFKEGFVTKSDVILSINQIFRKNGITIPFPQQDLHIRTITADLKQTVHGEKDIV